MTKENIVTYLQQDIVTNRLNSGRLCDVDICFYTTLVYAKTKALTYIVNYPYKGRKSILKVVEDYSYNNIKLCPIKYMRTTKLA